MRIMRKAAAVAAAVGLTVTGTMVSYADHTAVTNATELVDGGTADSTITGHIKVTNISVKVPVTSSFDIDPNKAVTAGGAGDTQMGAQATNYIITNMSTVPLDISITKVTPGAGVTLVKNVDTLGTTAKSVIFAIREASETPPKLPGTGGEDAKWLESGTLATPYKVSATSGKNTIQAADGVPGGADELAMQVYAATKKGWASGNSFTITPTFTVSLNTTP